MSLFLHGVKSFTPPDDFPSCVKMRRRAIPYPNRAAKLIQSTGSCSDTHNLWDPSDRPVGEYVP